MKDNEIWDEVHKRIHKEEEPHSKYAEKAEKDFPRDSIIAELGGGSGKDAVFFLSKGHSVVLLDISQFALSKAEEKAKTHNYESKLIAKQADFGLNKLPLKDNSVDVAYSRISLNYFGSERTAVVLHDIYRTLKKGGRAFLTFKSPDDEAEMELIQETATEYEPGVYIQGGQLRSRFSVEQLQNILQMAGIEDYKVEPYQEELPEIKGRKPILYVNEVTFTK